MANIDIKLGHKDEALRSGVDKVRSKIQSLMSYTEKSGKKAESTVVSIQRSLTKMKESVDRVKGSQITPKGINSFQRDLERLIKDLDKAQVKVDAIAKGSDTNIRPLNKGETHRIINEISKSIGEMSQRYRDFQSQVAEDAVNKAKAIPLTQQLTDAEKERIKALRQQRLEADRASKENTAHTRLRISEIRRMQSDLKLIDESRRLGPIFGDALQSDIVRIKTIQHETHKLAEQIAKMKKMSVTDPEGARASGQFITDAQASAVSRQLTDLNRQLDRTRERIKDTFSRQMRESMHDMQQAFVRMRQFLLTGFVVLAAPITALRGIVREAGEAEKALLALSREARASYLSGANAQNMAKDLDIVQNGVVSLGAAARAMKLAFRIGFNAEEAKQAVRQMTEIAIENKQSALTLDEALVNAFEGFKQELSQLADAAGVTKNISIIYKEYAESVGKSVGALTQREKALAIQVELDREAAKSAGALTDSYTTLSGSVDRLSGKWKIFIQQLGMELKPALTTLIGLLTNVIATIQEVSSFIPSAIKNGALVAAVLGTIATGLGIIVGGLGFFVQGIGIAINSIMRLGAALTTAAGAYGIFSKAFLMSNPVIMGTAALVSMTVALGTLSTALMYFRDDTKTVEQGMSDLKKESQDLSGTWTQATLALKKLREIRKELQQLDDHEITRKKALNNQVRDIIKSLDVEETTRSRLMYLIRDNGNLEVSTLNEVQSALEKTNQKRLEALKLQASMLRQQQELEIRQTRKSSAGDYYDLVAESPELKKRHEDSSSFLGLPKAYTPSNDLRRDLEHVEVGDVEKRQERLNKIFSDVVDERQQGVEALKEILKSADRVTLEEQREIVVFFQKRISSLKEMQSRVDKLKETENMTLEEFVKRVQTETVDISKITTGLKTAAGRRFADPAAIRRQATEAVQTASGAIFDIYEKAVKDSAGKIDPQKGYELQKAFDEVASAILLDGSMFRQADFQSQLNMLTEDKVVGEKLEKLLSDVMDSISKVEKTGRKFSDKERIDSIFSIANTIGSSRENMEFAIDEIRKYLLATHGNELEGLSFDNLGDQLEAANINNKLTDRALKSGSDGIVRQTLEITDLIKKLYTLHGKLQMLEETANIDLSGFRKTVDEIASADMEFYEFSTKLKGVSSDIRQAFADLGSEQSPEAKSLQKYIERVIRERRYTEKAMKEAGIDKVTKDINTDIDKLLKSSMSLREKFEALDDLETALRKATDQFGTNTDTRQTKTRLKLTKEQFEKEELDRAKEVVDEASKKADAILSSGMDLKSKLLAIQQLKSELNEIFIEEDLPTKARRGLDQQLRDQTKEIKAQSDLAKEAVKKYESIVTSKKKEARFQSVGSQKEQAVAEYRAILEAQKEFNETYNSESQMSADVQKEIQRELNEARFNAEKEYNDRIRSIQIQAANDFRDTFINGLLDVINETKKASDIVFDVFMDLRNKLLKAQIQSALKTSIFDKFLGGVLGGIVDSGSPAGASNVATSTSTTQINHNTFEIKTLDSSDFGTFLSKPENKRNLIGTVSDFDSLYKE